MTSLSNYYYKFMINTQEAEIATQLDTELELPHEPVNVHVIETSSQMEAEENGTVLFRTHRLPQQTPGAVTASLAPAVSIDSASGSTQLQYTRVEHPTNPLTRVVTQAASPQPQ